ncbi:hypothetical protein HUJ04_004186 [Dendroctonus ponderosae]|nr:hypothetical protein HUJ04_004186 [Dendroctonus ponderosae]
MAVSSVQMAVLVTKLETVRWEKVTERGALLGPPHSPASNCLPRSRYEFLPLAGRQDAWVAKIRSGNVGMDG